MTLATHEAQRNEFEAIIGSARLAPSSHNTQPWLFSVEQRRIGLYRDIARALPVNDPENRELAISCGCALFNLRVALANKGYGYSVVPPIERASDDLVAQVFVERQGPSDTQEAALFDYLETRRTYRKRLLPSAVPESVLEQLAAAAKQEGCWLETVAPHRRKPVATLVRDGDRVQWSNPAWREELMMWIRSRGAVEGLCVPKMISLLARFLVKHMDLGRWIAEHDYRQVLEAPCLVILGTQDDCQQSWLAAGQALQKVLLLAQSHGLQASFYNQPNQVESLRTRLQTMVTCAGSPQVMFRLGLPAMQTEGSGRRSVNSVTM